MKSSLEEQIQTRLDGLGGEHGPEISGSRIVFIAGDLGRGGAERQLIYFCGALLRLGAHPTVLSLTSGDYWEQHLRDMGIDVRWVGRSANRFTRLAHMLREVRKERADLIQSQHFYANLYATAIGKILSIPAIGAMRNDGYSEVRASGSVLGWMNLHTPQYVAANSRAAIAFAESQRVPRCRLRYIPNVVGDQFLLRTDRENRPVCRILGVGRLVKQKRFDLFLDAIAALRKTLSGRVEGMLIGDGRAEEDLGAELRNRAKRLGLTDSCLRFRGEVAVVQDEYAKADIFLLTSDHEGMPNVVLEAMATGLPVISTRVGAVPDVITDGEDGFLVEKGDVNSIVRRVKELIEDHSLRVRIGRNARNRIRSDFSENALERSLIGIYREILRNRWRT